MEQLSSYRPNFSDDIGKPKRTNPALVRPYAWGLRYDVMRPNRYVVYPDAFEDLRESEVLQEGSYYRLA